MLRFLAGIVKKRAGAKRQLWGAGLATPGELGILVAADRRQTAYQPPATRDQGASSAVQHAKGPATDLSCESVAAAEAQYPPSSPVPACLRFLPAIGGGDRGIGLSLTVRGGARGVPRGWPCASVRPSVGSF